MAIPNINFISHENNVPMIPRFFLVCFMDLGLPHDGQRLKCESYGSLHTGHLTFAILLLYEVEVLHGIVYAI